MYKRSVRLTPLVCLAVLGVRIAGAQPIGLEEAPTRGLYHPGAGIADGAEPFAVSLNPAALGELRALSLGLRHTELLGAAPFAPATRGTGLYAAAPVPYLSRLQLGAALEVLRPAPGPTARLALALSLRPLPFLSIGVTYGHLFAAPEHPHDGLNSVALGLRLRAGPWCALGLMVHDLNTPRGVGPTAPLQRVYEAELLGRPLGDDRLELGLGVRFGEQRLDAAPRLRLWARPRRGLGIGAEATALVDGGRHDLRVGAGLSLDFGHAGAGLYGLVGIGGDGVPGSGGGSVALRVSLERYPALPLAGRAHLVKLEPGQVSGVSFLQILERLRRLERDPAAAGVVLVLAELKVGWGRADELRAALLRLRRARKRVFVYGADLTTRAYYVATAAERIYLDPAGSLRVVGAASDGWNVKEALDLVGVRADLVRVGEYKAAPETFTRSEPSEPARRQKEELVTALYEHLVKAIAEGRRLPRERVVALIDRGLFSPAGARAAGLVDGVLRGEEVEEDLGRILGRRPRIAPPSSAPERPRSWAPRAVAVVNIEGDLAQGASREVPLIDMKTAGAETILRALDEADRDPRVLAVVVRVESPGGSALVADLLSRRVQALARRKPTVCSFGDVAASGGYYLAAPCTRLFASAGTVTGSIGIFGGKADVSGLLGRLGLRHSSYTRGAHADMEQYWRPYTPEERALIGEQLQHGYERFLEVVAAGRHISRAEAHALGRGRVWTGGEAIQRRLCDEEGGLMDAVAAARRLASVGEGEDLELRYLPQRDTGLLGQALRLLGLPAPQAALPGLARLAEALGGLRAALLLLETPVLARMEQEPPR